ncbi:Ubiquitin domain-containing protein 2 [Borealophlyctis nickersoniae]|nr:Ubiquitin domain-containing protein 2 [Borealophlyctis nickersoniae]
MGCCFSRDGGRQGGDDTGSLQGIPTGGNKPLVPRKSLVWTSDTPLTRRELDAQRDAFWDTQPAYSGRPEIWQALRAACESPTLDLAQAILDSANITIPTGNLADGCYDELGNQYVIPLMCQVDPTNIVVDGTASSVPADSTDAAVPGAGGAGSSTPHSEHTTPRSSTLSKLTSTLKKSPSPPSPPSPSSPTAHQKLTITARLNTGKDLPLRILPTDTIGVIKRMVEESQGLNQSAGTEGGEKDELTRVRLRFFLMGKVLEEGMTVEGANVREGSVVQVMVAPVL